MEVLNRAMELLKDGKWHDVEELQTKLGLIEFKAKLLVNFLVSYGFCVHVTGNTVNIKLKPKVLSFLEELEVEGTT